MSLSQTDLQRYLTHRTVHSLRARLESVEKALAEPDHSPTDTSTSQNEQEQDHHIVPMDNIPAPIQRQLANPAPLGLFGFAIAAGLSGIVRLSSDSPVRNASLVSIVSFFLGGTAQLVAAIFQFLNNHAHSATTFAVYGLHWVSVSFLAIVRSLYGVENIANTPPLLNAVYSALFVLVSFILFIPTLRMNRILQANIFSVMLIYAFDIGAAYQYRAADIAAGISALCAASLSLYLALLDLVNETWKRPVLPLFPHKEHRHEYEWEDGLPYLPKMTFHKSAFSPIHV